MDYKEEELYKELYSACASMIRASVGDDLDEYERSINSIMFRIEGARKDPFYHTSKRLSLLPRIFLTEEQYGFLSDLGINIWDNGAEKIFLFTNNMAFVPVVRSESVMWLENAIFPPCGWRTSDVRVSKEETDSEVIMEMEDDDVLISGYEIGDDQTWWTAHKNEGRWVITKKWYRNEVCQLWRVVFDGAINAPQELVQIMKMCDIPIAAPNDERSVATDAKSE